MLVDLFSLVHMLVLRSCISIVSHVVRQPFGAEPLWLSMASKEVGYYHAARATSQSAYLSFLFSSMPVGSRPTGPIRNTQGELSVNIIVFSLYFLRFYLDLIYACNLYLALALMRC